MAVSPADLLVLVSLVLALAGAGLLAHARVQTRLLRARVAAGSSTQVIDPVTGLHSPQAAWQCIRAEASRATRLQRPIDVWVGTAPGASLLDEAGRDLALAMPPGASGIRVDDRRLCVVSCAGDAASPVALLDGVTWVRQRVEPGEGAAAEAHEFVMAAGGVDG